MNVRLFRSGHARKLIPWLLLLTPWTAFAGGGEGQLEARFSDRVESVRGQLIELRRDLHRNPEVSGQEERTARLVAERLKGLGFQVRTSVGGHGVVGLLRGGAPGPTVAFRADMDAVYSNDPDPAPFKSERPGIRHICGHDLHTTIGVALAEGFAEIREQLPGSILLIFQPAEERADGARAMIADGALDWAKPDAIFSLHTAPFEVGRIATARGVLMPGRDRVRVTVGGAGDHDAAARRVREALESFGTVSSPFEGQPRDSNFVLAQARVDGGSGEVRVDAILTLASPAARERVQREIPAKLEQIERELPDISLGYEYEARLIAGVDNDPRLVDQSLAAARSVLGLDAVVALERIVPAFSEDFGSFQDQVPGVMFFLGVSNSGKGWVGMPHTADYMADEEAIFVGARVMAAIMLDLSANPVPR